MNVSGRTWSRWRTAFLAVCGLLAFFPAQALVLFSEGFETPIASPWQVGDANPVGSTAYWDRVNSGFGGESTHGGSFKAYCAGVGYIGATNSPNYRDSMTAYLQRTVDLTSVSHATLSFYHKTPNVELGQDIPAVYIDGTPLWIANGNFLTWTLVTLNLDAYVGGTHTLRFEFKSDIGVVAEGWYLDDIQLTDAYTPGTPPTNDVFTTATVITNAVGAASGKNQFATNQLNEPQPGNTVWYRWTAPTNGPVTFTTANSSFDTVLCAYTGPVLTNLVSLGCNDDGTTNGASELAFTAVKGTNYYLAVRGAGGAFGDIVLAWNQPAGAGVELLPDLSVYASVPNKYLYGWYLDQQEIPGRTLLRLSTATPNLGAGTLELRGSSSQAGVFQRVFLSGGGSYDRYAGTFTFHPGHGHLHFDNWLNFRLRSNTNGGVGDIVAGGHKTSFAIIDLTWQNPTLPGSPSTRAYNGGLVQGLSIGWMDVYSASLADQWIDVTGLAAGSYWLEAVVDPDNHIKESDETNNTTRILINFVPPPVIDTTRPPNDDLANATVIPGVTGGFSGDNFSATGETGEPRHAGQDGGLSVWFRWTAPSNQTVAVTTEGSRFDTLLAVYTGTNTAALTAVASNDNLNGLTNTSSLTFSALAGQTYRIAVDGKNGTSSNYQFHFNPAWNDHFTNPVVLAGNSGRITGSNRGASRQTNEPAHASLPATNSVWYTWTPGLSGAVTFDTLDSTFNTRLAVYTGTNLTNLTLVAANNDGPYNQTSLVTFDGQAGVTYRLAVDGIAPDRAGAFNLHWSGPAAPSIDQDPVSTNALAGAAVPFTAVVSGSAPIFYQWQHEGTNLTDDIYVSGATNLTLLLPKVLPADIGSYVLIVSNAYGRATSAPAQLIVIDNARVFFADYRMGQVGGVVSVPVHMQALGDEQSVDFSLNYDPALLLNPRVGGNAAGAAITLITNEVICGRLGVSLALPPGQSLPAGTREWARFLFDAAENIPGQTVTAIGFGNEPVARRVLDTNGLVQVTLFAAGQVEFYTVNARQNGSLLTDGQFWVSLQGLAGRTYVIQGSTNLTEWTPLFTNQTTLDGLLDFVDGGATNQTARFYRAVLVPR